MDIFEIPLIPENQRMVTSMNGVNYILSIIWNYENSTWVMEILDINGNSLIAGIALVNDIDLLGQYAYVGIGVAMAIIGDVPTYGNLGTGARLYFS